jgi:hypothetical protein
MMIIYVLRGSFMIRIVYFKYFNLGLLFIFINERWRLKHLKLHGYYHSGD